MKLKQQDQKMHITINRYVKTEEFVFTIRFDMKKDKKEETLSFIEEAWICRTGAIFQRFSVKRRQAQSECESESHTRGGLHCGKKNHEENARTPMHTKIEKPRKKFWEKWIAEGVMNSILMLKKMSESLKKKEI